MLNVYVLGDIVPCVVAEVQGYDKFFYIFSGKFLPCFLSIVEIRFYH